MSPRPAKSREGFDTDIASMRSDDLVAAVAVTLLVALMGAILAAPIAAAVVWAWERLA